MSNDEYKDIFRVIKYSEDSLAEALSNDFVSIKHIKKKSQYLYLLDYLGETDNDALAAKTIIIENNYISRSYIKDFSNYYSLCFSEIYKKKTKRIHFFNITFNQEQFINDIINNGNLINEQTYLGYIVVKNLPSVIIGATILKTYKDNDDDDKNKRHFIKRKTEISIFGKKLHLDSLIFQEQDKVISACATTALWISFYKLSNFFHTFLPSPSEITLSARNSYEFSGRSFPNKEGLDHFQIGNAIENIGLVFELRNNKILLNDPLFIKSFIYSYLKLGIPVLLGLNIIHSEKKGYHLITISGYKDPEVINYKHNTIKKVFLYSSELELFFAHDDRVGPYSKLYISNNHKNKEGIVETSWITNPITKNKIKADIISIIVPIYRKIRLSFEDILNEVRSFDYFFKELHIKNFIWDVFLNTNNDYKNEILNNDDLPSFFKKKILFRQLPRYLWIANLLIDNYLAFQLVFDSTDVALGHSCLLINCFDDGLLAIFKNEFEKPGFKDFVINYLDIYYLDLIKKQMFNISN